MSIFKKKKIDEKSMAYEKAKERVMELHNNAVFLMYIDDAYIKKPYGQVVEGIVAIGKTEINREFFIYSCEGEYVTSIKIKDAYIKNDQVYVLEAGNENISLYPEEKNDRLIAGQIMVIL